MIPGRRVRILAEAGRVGTVTGTHHDDRGQVWVMVRTQHRGAAAVGYLPTELELELELEAAA